MLGGFTGRSVYDYDVNLMAMMHLRGNDWEDHYFCELAKSMSY
jgi:hypothetical protein